MKNNGSPSDYAIALNQDGSLLFVTDQTTGNLSIWNVDTLSLMNNDNFQTQNITDVVFNTIGTLVMSGGAGQMVDVWGILPE
jgi:WD40 repeat protein